MIKINLFVKLAYFSKHITIIIVIHTFLSVAIKKPKLHNCLEHYRKTTNYNCYGIVTSFFSCCFCYYRLFSFLFFEEEKNKGKMSLSQVYFLSLSYSNKKSEMKSSGHLFT